MYAPHTVTVYNVLPEVDMTTFEETETAYVTILRGVFLDAAKAVNVRSSGIESADAVNLFIPFSADAYDGHPGVGGDWSQKDYDGIITSDEFFFSTGVSKRFVSPHEFISAQDKRNLWTLAGDGYGVETFFVKGEVVTTAAAARAHDYSFKVTKVDIKDYGSPSMQHFEVGGA